MTLQKIIQTTACSDLSKLTLPPPYKESSSFDLVISWGCHPAEGTGPEGRHFAKLLIEAVYRTPFSIYEGSLDLLCEKYESLNCNIRYNTMPGREAVLPLFIEAVQGLLPSTLRTVSKISVINEDASIKVEIVPSIEENNCCSTRNQQPPLPPVERYIVAPFARYAGYCSWLIPSLRYRDAVQFSLSSVIAEALRHDSSFPSRDPAAIRKAILDHQEKAGAGFSFGGWMEDRESVFKGTYMDKDRRYIHLGLDINIDAGAKVCFPAAARVLSVTVSTDREVGWGTRIDLLHPKLPLVFLIGHLSPEVSVKEGDTLKGGQALGTVGDPSVNGNVDPHIHIQAMDLALYERLKKINDIDGYGTASTAAEIEVLKKSYPHPIEALKLFIDQERRIM